MKKKEVEKYLHKKVEDGETVSPVLDYLLNRKTPPFVISKQYW